MIHFFIYLPNQWNRITSQMSELINLNKESFDKVVSTGNKTLIIDFWAPWCGPCKQLTPVLENLVNKKINISSLRLVQ